MLTIEQFALAVKLFGFGCIVIALARAWVSR